MKAQNLLFKWLIVLTAVIGLGGCQAVVTPPPSVVEKPPEVFEAPVFVKQIESSRECPIGYWAEAQSGDFLIENEKIRLVVSNYERESQFAPAGGNIIDIARKEDNLDYFGEMFFAGFECKFERSKIVLPDEENPEAVLRLYGRALNNPDLLVVQEYRLGADDSVVRIITSIENKTTESVSIDFKDSVYWGASMLFIGRRGSPSPAEVVEVQTDWLCGRIENYSVGLTTSKGMLVTKNMKNTSEVSYRKASIAPGSRETFERYLYVADRNISQIMGFMIDLRDEPSGIITGTVVDTAEEKPIPSVEVRVRSNRIGEEETSALPYVLSYSREDGTFEIPVQTGSYFVTAHPFGRTASPNALSIDVPQGYTYVLKLKVSPEIYLSYEITDPDTKEPIPAKLTFISLPGKPMLDFGYSYNAPGSQNTYYAYKGKGEIPVSPGLYKIIVSRGCEYEIVEEEIRILPGQLNELKVNLERVVDTSGWISADIGVRTENSYNCLVTPRDRVIAAVCEGVEWIVTGDEGGATDLQSVVDELGLTKWIKASSGYNLAFTGTQIPGNFLVFPISQQAAARLSATKGEMAGWNADRIFSFIRDTAPDALIQVNFPLDPEEGYYVLNGYDKEQDTLPEEGSISTDFDLLNVWQGKRMQELEENITLYNNLVNTGQIKHFSAGSFSRYVYGEETGYPRTYIMSATDNPAEINVQELVDNLRSGKTMLSNGPFIHFDVEEKGYTEMVQPGETLVNCGLLIYAAPWVNVGVINVNRGGSFAKWVFLPPYEEIKRYPRKKEGKEEFKITVKEDNFMNIVVKGTKSMEPVVSPLSFPEGAPMMPFAICAPIFLDIDGDGQFNPKPEE